MCLSTLSRADGLEDEFQLTSRSAYLRWMAETELSGRGAPLAIANQPCIAYDGSRIVVFPCPGTLTFADTVEQSVRDRLPPVVAGCGQRHRQRFACVSRRY